MKKFLSYSIVATLFIVVMGVMVIFGVFDIKSGSLDLIGVNSNVNPVDIHNEIVEEVHSVALGTSEVSQLFSDLNVDSSLDSIKREVETVNDKMRKLNKLIMQLENNNKQAAVTEGYESYGKALEVWVNNYLKSFTFFEQKGLSQENIDSFKESINNAQNSLNEAHNSYTEILNSAR
ncbi:hypothetical protein ACFL3T_03645 [Patescibacteria group bacterium]